jgi:hypothetical protein
MNDVQPFDLSSADEPWLDLDMEHGHPLQRGIMPIVLHRGDTWRVEGTAFAVGPQLLLTAKHNLVDANGLRGDEAHVLYIDGRNPDVSYNGGLLPVERLNTNGQTDLAALQIGLPLIDGKLLRIATLPISFAPPSPDDACLAIGYTATTAFDEQPEVVRLELAPALHTSRGRVVDVHHRGRDSSFLPFPVFHTTAHIPPQMSGSPILAGSEPDRRVVGVASTGYDVEPTAEPISYGSLLWPAAGLRMAMQNESGPVDVSLLELAQMGYLTADESVHAIELDTTDPDAWTVGLRG